MFSVSNGGGAGGGSTIYQSGTFNTIIQSGTIVDISTGVLVRSPGNPNENTSAGIFYELSGPRDPGVPFSVEGRGKLIHGLTMQAGSSKFTNGSDHFHLVWTSQQASNWQMMQGGDNSSVANRFLLHTPGRGYNQSFYNEANAYSLDTSLVTGLGANTSFSTTGIKLKYNTSGNLPSGSYVALTVSPGMAGIVGGTYNGTTTTGPMLNASGKYETFLQLDFLQPFNFNIQGTGEELKYITSSAVNSFRLNLFPSAIAGANVSLSGNYLNVPFHILVTKNGHNAFVGQSLVLNISDDNFAAYQGRGFYDSWVRDVIDDNNFVLEAGSQLHTFHVYPLMTGSLGPNGWFLVPGTTDAVHRPTANQQVFFFERYPTATPTGIKMMGGLRNFSIGTRSTAYQNESFCVGLDNFAAQSGTVAIGRNIRNDVSDSLEIGVNKDVKVAVRKSGVILPITNVNFSAGTGQNQIPINGLYFSKSGNNVVASFNDGGVIRSNNLISW